MSTEQAHYKRVALGTMTLGLSCPRALLYSCEWACASCGLTKGHRSIRTSRSAQCIARTSAATRVNWSAVVVATVPHMSARCKQLGLARRLQKAAPTLSHGLAAYLHAKPGCGHLEADSGLVDVL